MVVITDELMELVFEHYKESNIQKYGVTFGEYFDMVQKALNNL